MATFISAAAPQLSAADQLRMTEELRGDEVTR
jgi:hypothetical protein